MTLNLDAVYLAIVAALSLRFAVLVATLPFLDQRSVPVLWRVALAVVVALAVAPVVAERGAPLPDRLTWTLILDEAVRSLLVGALMSFAIGILFTAIRYAGNVMGMQVGFAIVNTIDPQSGGQISILAQFYYLLAVLIFFAMDAQHVMLRALVESCTAVPLFTPLQAEASAWLLLRDFGAIFKLGLQIAAPCILVLLMLSATMGVIVKTVPQINVLVVGFPIKIAVGLLTVGLSLTFFREIVVNALQGLDGQLMRQLAALQ